MWLPENLTSFTFVIRTVFLLGQMTLEEEYWDQPREAKGSCPTAVSRRWGAHMCTLRMFWGTAETPQRVRVWDRKAGYTSNGTEACEFL